MGIRAVVIRLRVTSLSIGLQPYTCDQTCKSAVGFLSEVHRNPDTGAFKELESVSLGFGVGEEAQADHGAGEV